MSKFSRAETDRIHDLVAARAGSTLRCSSSRCAQRVTFTCSASFSRFVSMPGGGTGAAIPRTFSRIHRPRVTGEVRVPTELTVRKLPCPRMPATRAAASSETRRK